MSSLENTGVKKKVKEFIDDEYAVRFLEMGILPEMEIEVLRKAPFDGAYYIRTEKGVFALRKEELEHIRTY